MIFDDPRGRKNEAPGEQSSFKSMFKGLLSSVLGATKPYNGGGGSKDAAKVMQSLEPVVKGLKQELATMEKTFAEVRAFYKSAQAGNKQSGGGSKTSMEAALAKGSIPVSNKNAKPAPVLLFI